MKEGIVDFGKRIFQTYHSDEINLDQLITRIKRRKCSDNDFSVLSCYCEKDKDATFELYKIRDTKEAKELYKEFVFSKSLLKGCGFIFMNRLQIYGLSLDNYFKCDIFFKEIVKIWKSVWGKDFNLIMKEILDFHTKNSFKSWSQFIDRIDLC